MLDTSYDVMMMLLRHTDAKIHTLRSQEFDQKEIMGLLSDQMRQIFDDMYAARVIARGRTTKDDPVQTVAGYIWAILQAHVVMAEYASHDIRRHPSISSKIMCQHL